MCKDESRDSVSSPNVLQLAHRWSRDWILDLCISRWTKLLRVLLLIPPQGHTLKDILCTFMRSKLHLRRFWKIWQKKNVSFFLFRIKSWKHLWGFSPTLELFGLFYTPASKKEEVHANSLAGLTLCHEGLLPPRGQKWWCIYQSSFK